MTTLYRFYRIVGTGDKEYIGHTRSPLSKRMYQHKQDYQLNRSSTSCRIVFEEYGIENCSIVLIHEMALHTVDEARREERRLVEERRDVCVNIHRPIISTEERQAYIKQYNDDHKGDRKQYREDRKEIILQKGVEYRNANRETIRQKNTERYIKNHEQYNAHRREKIVCDVCGKSINRGNMTRHKTQH